MQMPVNKYQNQSETKRLILAMIGMVAVVLFVAIFGLKILVGFSLFIDKLRGASPKNQNNQVLILPPVLDPLPEATNSATLIINGRGTGGLTAVIYLNETENKKLTVPPDGNFKASIIGKDGSNTISAKLLDEQGNMSNLSNVIFTSVKNKPPVLELTSPEANATIVSEKNIVIVSGKSEDGNTVVINGRLALVQNDGSFNYSLSLNEGENIIKIVATDLAGNSITIERKVTYRRE